MITRRFFLKATLAGAVFLPLKKVYALTDAGRSLSLHNIHTDESIDVTYFNSGQYDSEALDAINRIMRCHYTDEAAPIDVGVLDLLSDIRQIADYAGTIEIISGFRSERYNAHLRRLGRRVAKSSLHLQGLAVDFAMPGISNNKLFEIAKSFASGGVGRYSDFVHIDVGRIRYW